MKFIITLFFAAFACQGFAQMDSQKMLYIEKAEKYRRMRNAGATLTTAGTVVAIIGISTMVNADMSSYNSQTGTVQNTGSKAATGAVMYVLGVASVGAGIPLWIVGGHAHNKYQRKLNALNVGLRIGPVQSGVSVSYRF